MMLSGVSTGFMGSKYTRLLKQGEAGHTVAMVEVSWMERPCGSSSRCIRLRTPPYFGVSARAELKNPVGIASTMVIHSHRFMSVSSCKGFSGYPLTDPAVSPCTVSARSTAGIVDRKPDLAMEE